jgi:TPR repeat protein
MNKRLTLVCLALTLLLQGCYTPFIEGAQQGYDGAKRNSLEAGASSGDPSEEFKLGNTYCCQGAGPLHDLSIYDNEKATHWYCRAARQGYEPAQRRLAQLYSGHAIRGLHIVLRASDLMGTDETNLSVALMWANLAAKKGGADALELRDEILKLATADERGRADAYAKEWRSVPCRWEDVISVAHKKTEQ